MSEHSDHSCEEALGDARDALERVRADLATAEIALASARLRVSALEADSLHRVRNVLAVVRSIFSRTVESADTLESAADHFRGRLDTLAQYQLLSTSEWRFYLEDMIRDALLAFAAFDDSRIEIAGPEVRLLGRHAEAIGLALHELVTNSIKFGVLSPGHKGGTLRLAWTLDDDTLSFRWDETGVAILSAAPMRVGFGRRYIEEALPYQLGAQTSFALAAGRLSCTLVVPLANRRVLDTPDRG